MAPYAASAYRLPTCATSRQDGLYSVLAAEAGQAFGSRRPIFAIGRSAAQALGLRRRRSDPKCANRAATPPQRRSTPG
jgi:hypothetical protein